MWTNQIHILFVMEYFEGSVQFWSLAWGSPWPKWNHIDMKPQEMNTDANYVHIFIYQAHPEFWLGLYHHLGCEWARVAPKPFLSLSVLSYKLKGFNQKISEILSN